MHPLKNTFQFLRPHNFQIILSIQFYTKTRFKNVTNGQSPWLSAHTHLSLDISITCFKRIPAFPQWILLSSLGCLWGHQLIEEMEFTGQLNQFKTRTSPPKFVTTRGLLGTRSSGHKILEVCIASKMWTCDAGDTQRYLRDDRHSTFKLTKFIYNIQTKLCRIQN